MRLGAKTCVLTIRSCTHLQMGVADLASRRRSFGDGVRFRPAVEAHFPYITAGRAVIARFKTL